MMIPNDAVVDDVDSFPKTLFFLLAYMRIRSSAYL